MRTIEELAEENQKLKKILANLLPDKSGHYFICGESGDKDANGLPERIMVCPIYGSDLVQMYAKLGETSGPGW